MKFKRMLLLNFTGKELVDDRWEEVKSLGAELVLIKQEDQLFFDHLRETDCLLVKLGAKVPQELLNSAPKLKYIGMLGTGYGGIDVEAATKKKITVTNIANYATEGVAEFTFAVLLAHLRKLEEAKNQARKLNFDESAYFDVSEIKGKTLGIIGLGNIGLRVAEIGKAFGANVIYWSRKRKATKEKKGFAYVKIEKLLAQSDFISLNLALNKDTKHFIDKKNITLIKGNSVVVNLSPMELIEIDSFLAASQEKGLHLILDHSDELSTDEVNKIKPFMDQGGTVTVYPPVAYTTIEATNLKQKIFVDNLRAYLAGKPKNKVN